MMARFAEIVDIRANTNPDTGFFRGSSVAPAPDLPGGIELAISMVSRGSQRAMHQQRPQSPFVNIVVDKIMRRMPVLGASGPTR